VTEERMQIDPHDLQVSIPPSAEEGSIQRFMGIVTGWVEESLSILAAETANAEKMNRNVRE